MNVLKYVVQAMEITPVMAHQIRKLLQLFRTTIIARIFQLTPTHLSQFAHQETTVPSVENHPCYIRNMI